MTLYEIVLSDLGDKNVRKIFQALFDFFVTFRADRFVSFPVDTYYFGNAAEFVFREKIW